MSFLVLKVDPEIAESSEIQLVEADNKKVTPQHVHSFRLYDGDMTLYFEGVSTINETFEPLDDFGKSYGCTEIHWRQANGEFAAL